MFSPVYSIASVSFVFWPATIEKPPAEYMVTKEQMDPSVEVYMPPIRVDQVCQMMGVTMGPGGRYLVACYVPENDTIYLPNNLKGSALEALRIHEHSHRVKGWRHNYDRTW
jgi:hypothetical protein